LQTKDGRESQSFEMKKKKCRSTDRSRWQECPIGIGFQRKA
jgi:hypothetical protein